MVHFGLVFGIVGLMKWNPHTGQFKHIFPIHQKLQIYANTSIASLKKDDKGNLWIGTFNGLYRMRSR